MPSLVAAQTTGAAVRATDLDLGWGRQPVLTEASFAIEPGATTALIGPNGAGKSTLLHAIAGLRRPMAGALDVPAQQAPGGVAYVLQATTVNERLPLTVREAVTMGRYARTGPLRRLRADDHAAIAAALDALRIGDLAARPLHELSGGQRQRVFVAQGLAQGASLLLLDEPVTGLDVLSRDCIVEALAAERARGNTVIVSTHSLGEASLADHVLLLSGRVVASGPPDDVLTAAALADAYGARLLRLGDDAFIVDDPHHHTDHAHDGHTGPLGHHGHEH